MDKNDSNALFPKRYSLFNLTSIAGIRPSWVALGADHLVVGLFGYTLTRLPAKLCNQFIELLSTQAIGSACKAE